MQGNFPIFLLGALLILLLIAAISDLRTREIPNWLNSAIALLVIPFWFSIGLDPWPEIALRIGLATIILLVFALLFHFKMMGGGDVKMLAALTLWFTAGAVLKLLVIMSIAGGILTLAMLLWCRLKKNKNEIEVPYGVAIAFGGFWIIAEPFLNHFT